jgi:hypothetical protein
MRDALLTHSHSREIGQHHSNLTMLRQRYGLRRQYYTFSVVRNPADIFVSEWLGNKHTLFEHIRNRLDCDDPNNLFFRHSSTVNHILRYENLQLDLDTLFGGLGIPFVVLSVVGVTPGKQHWQNYYDEKTYSYLVQHCPEMKKFGYSA